MGAYLRKVCIPSSLFSFGLKRLGSCSKGKVLVGVVRVHTLAQSLFNTANGDISECPDEQFMLHGRCYRLLAAAFGI